MPGAGTRSTIGASACRHSWDRVAALGDIIGGARAGRTSDDQIVICELQGIGIEDVAVAELVARRAGERGVGLELPA